MFEEIKKCKDEIVQEVTLHAKNLECDQLEWLETNGLNKKIWNMAKLIKTQKERKMK